jgi:chromosome segregation ATPase
MASMNDSKRTRRTPEQLIADAQSRLDKLQAKAAESEAATNPLLAPLLAEIKEVEKVELMARKGFSKGPQNFEARIAKAQARIEKVQGQMVNANGVIETAKERKAELRSALTLLTQRIAQGEDISEDEVLSSLYA